MDRIIFIELALKILKLYVQFLKSDSHENFCQIKIFRSLDRKNTIICLFGV